jgi:hypothetical protein
VQISGFAGQGCWIYKKAGTKGTPGTEGGNGGLSGNGAKAGTILVNSPQINKIAKLGRNGVPGRGGKGGKGGDHGQLRYFQCHIETMNTLLRFYYTAVSLEPTGRAPHGIDGIAGVAGTLSNAADPQPFEPLTTVAAEYKQFVQQKKSRFVDSPEFIDRYIKGSRKRRTVSEFYTTPRANNSQWTPQSLMPLDHKPGNLGTKSLSLEFSFSSMGCLHEK